MGETGSRIVEGPGQAAATDRLRTMFMYWGRRGAGLELLRGLTEAANRGQDLDLTVSVSRQGEAWSWLRRDTDSVSSRRIFPVSTFSSGPGAVLGAWRIPAIRGALKTRILHDRIEVVVDVMPHVWSPLVAPAIRSAGALYAPIIHDARRHPGDQWGFAASFAERALGAADCAITLSANVRERVLATGVVPSDRLLPLFLPDLSLPVGIVPAPVPGSSLRVMFLGRILPYKGLRLLLDAVSLARANGHRIDLGVFGEGDLDGNAGRLLALNAEVVNRWLAADEIASAFSRYDVVALPYLEASQSGVAALAFGAGCPIVATPVGGLLEQTRDGVNGIMAGGIDAEAFAAALMRLSDDIPLRKRLRAGVAATRADRSMDAFVEQLGAGLRHARRRALG